MVKFHTSRTEIEDILKAWFAISVAFGIVLLNIPFSQVLHNPLSLIMSFVFAGLTVGISFLAHEMSHKIMAQRYGCYAEFRSFDAMLILAVLMSFFGVVFAAPGAVMIAGRISNKKEGNIAIAGPAMNIILAIIFIPIVLLSTGSIHAFAIYGVMINSWIALFNMIPFGMFDGLKIWKSNRLAYIVLALAAFALMSAQFWLK